ncbi:MAG: hypothetical protein A2Y23_04120 [Clostridiales bacterium GWB2_37_7]|nr:MAG: hypothetical protein A2Y23_04120 [Clostridiales bacterium GWB2_37_7]
MEVKIAHEAEQYIKKNGQAVMVQLIAMSGCCGGAAPMPQIQLGSPKDLSGYIKTEIGDITVFVDVKVDMTKQINIFLGKLLWLAKLQVELI